MGIVGHILVSTPCVVTHISICFFTNYILYYFKEFFHVVISYSSMYKSRKACYVFDPDLLEKPSYFWKIVVIHDKIIIITLYMGEVLDCLLVNLILCTLYTRLLEWDHRLDGHKF